VETWRVCWHDSRGQEQRREFATFVEAWDFNEQELKGRGEVTLLTDRQLASDRSFRNEAAAARQVEGGRRYAKKK
jgi:hypothetical protein